MIPCDTLPVAIITVITVTTVIIQTGTKTGLRIPQLVTRPTPAGINMIGIISIKNLPVCLAIPLYEQRDLLKKNYKAVLFGLFSGVLTSLCTVFVLSLMMGLSHEEYVTLLPKSITTAIGMGVSEELGGYVVITVAVIIVTGVIGNIFGELICKIFRITEPISKGLAFGSAAHAIGTAKAIEIGEVEGAMSGLAIAVSGIITVLLASVFANFI